MKRKTRETQTIKGKFRGFTINPDLRMKIELGTDRTVEEMLRVFPDCSVEVTTTTVEEFTNE